MVPLSEEVMVRCLIVDDDGTGIRYLLQAIRSAFTWMCRPQRMATSCGY